MKRSAQVALVLMGVTGTTAAGAYMMPPRPECKPAPAASTTLNPPQALNPGAPAAAAAEPCRRRSWSGWRWNSSGSSYSSYSSSSSSSGPYRRTTTSNYRRSSAPPPSRPRSHRPDAAAAAAAHQQAQAPPPRVAASDRPAPQCPAAVPAAERHRHAECRVSATREFHATAITGLFAISGSIDPLVRVCAGAEIGHVKRSENVGLVVMGAAAFAATFAGGMALVAWQKPSHAAQPQTVADQRCTTRSDGTQDCQPQRRGFALLSRSAILSMAGRRAVRRAKTVTREAALVSNSRSGAASVPNTGVQRSGFGSTAKSTSIRVSAGG